MLLVMSVIRFLLGVITYSIYLLLSNIPGARGPESMCAIVDDFGDIGDTFLVKATVLYISFIARSWTIKI